MLGLPNVPNLGPLILRGIEALERLAEAQEHANRLGDETVVALSRIEAAVNHRQKPLPAPEKPAAEPWGKTGKP